MFTVTTFALVCLACSIFTSLAVALTSGRGEG
jgi:hypothetical protein